MSVRLNIPEIVLASKSPRRSMLLEQVGIPFAVIHPHGDERVPNENNFEAVVVENSEAKAVSVIPVSNGRAILGADTIVNIDGRPLGKPVDAGEAAAMLKSLSGRDHFVHSGIVLADPANSSIYRDAAVTKVRFRRLTDAEIDEYIASGEPFDKAGSYGIQGRGALFIDRIEGCFFNLMGLPLSRFWQMLQHWLEEIG